MNFYAEFHFTRIVEHLSMKIDKVKVYDIPISIDFVFFGGKKQIKIPVVKACPICNGKGYVIRDEKCALCNGTGKLKFVADFEFGQVVEYSVCPRCLGTGKVIEKCECDDGKIVENEIIEINIPRGIENNTLILLKNKDRYNPAIYGRIRLCDDFFKVNHLDLVAEIVLTREQVKKNDVIEIRHPLKMFRFFAEDLIKEDLIIENFGLINSFNETGDLIIRTKMIE